MTVICAMMQLSCGFSGFAFVDDTDLCVSGHSNITQTAKMMQSSITNWEGLLRTTGGALVPEKCFWYLIEQTWSDGKWMYKPNKTIPANLKVVDTHGHLNTIPRLEVTEARRTLGVRLAPDSNSTEELCYLKMVAIEWKKKWRKQD